jgi:hypothetical protein
MTPVEAREQAYARARAEYDTARERAVAQYMADCKVAKTDAERSAALAKFDATLTSTREAYMRLADQLEGEEN